MAYRLNILYLVRNKASCQSFKESIFGLVCFHNKCTLIKAVLKVSNDVNTYSCKPHCYFRAGLYCLQYKHPCRKQSNELPIPLGCSEEQTDFIYCWLAVIGIKPTSNGWEITLQDEWQTKQTSCRKACISGLRLCWERVAALYWSYVCFGGWLFLILLPVS